MNEKPHYSGHRKRLKERFLKTGGEMLPDYEMLELVLYLALSRSDVKPLAKRLLERFGGYAEVISADASELKEIDGVGDAVVAALKTVRDAAVRLAKEEVYEKPVLSSWQSLMDYCRSSMGFAKTEQFRVFFLNRKNMLIADEIQQEGTVDHTPVYPREVVKRALELGATAIILAHNHPSGDAAPSKNDIEITREIKEAGEKLGIVLHDHIVVARNGTTSFKSSGLI